MLKISEKHRFALDSKEDRALLRETYTAGYWYRIWCTGREDSTVAYKMDAKKAAILEATDDGVLPSQRQHKGSRYCCLQIRS